MIRFFNTVDSSKNSTKNMGDEWDYIPEKSTKEVIDKLTLINNSLPKPNQSITNFINDLRKN